MDRELQEIYAEVFRRIPEDRQNAIANILADPEKHGIELMNLFTSGNYAYAGGSDWDDRDKERIDDAREEFELTMGKEYNYISSGFAGKTVEKDDRNKHAPHFDPKATINKDESITVKMTELNSRHAFTFTKEAISDFYYKHPIRGRSAIAEHFAIMGKCQNTIRCQPHNEKQLILNGGGKETITAVYRDIKESIDDRGKIHYSTEWSFISHSESGDLINFACGDEIRYCAFIEAFKTALIDGTRGGVYEWLYQAICCAA